MIVNFWPLSFRRRLGPDGQWPHTYCAIDTETSGFDPSSDLVLEWGHCLVRENQVVDRLSLLIDWSNHPRVDRGWLRGRLNAVAQAMQGKGVRYTTTVEKLQREGWKPEKAFAFIREFMATLESQRVMLVAHSGLFDERMLSANMQRFQYGPGFTFGDNWIDTECIEKATQAHTNGRMHPELHETLRAYWHRIRYTRLKIKSNLSDHCFQKYNFAAKGVDAATMHGASTDAYCCHLLMQAYAAQITDQPLLRSSPAPAAGNSAAALPTTARRRGQRCS